MCGVRRQTVKENALFLDLSRLMCEECPSSSSNTECAGGIDFAKWFFSQPLNSSESIHPS
jgi:hypothetical protein